MAIWLKQSTATTIRMGPFVQASDGYSMLATTVTISATAVRRAKAGANWVGNGATAGAATSITMPEAGWAQVSFAATDVDTVGPLHFYIPGTVTGTFLPVWAECFVMPANVYDSLVGTDNLQVDVIQVTGAAPSAAAMGADLRFVLGAAVNTALAQVGVNVVTVTGAAVTSITYNANVLLVTGSAVSNATVAAGSVLDYVMFTPGVQTITVKDTLKTIAVAAGGRLDGATGAAVRLYGPSGDVRVSAAVVSGNRTGTTWVTG